MKSSLNSFPAARIAARGSCLGTRTTQFPGCWMKTDSPFNRNSLGSTHGLTLAIPEKLCRLHGENQCRPSGLDVHLGGRRSATSDQCCRKSALQRLVQPQGSQPGNAEACRIQSATRTSSSFVSSWMSRYRTPFCFETPGGMGFSSAPRKNATFTYFVRQW